MYVFRPEERPIIWCPKQIPNIGSPESKILVTSAITSGIALGSPGPLERKKPSGFHANISSIEVCIGKTFIKQSLSAKQRKIFRLTPKSSTATL